MDSIALTVRNPRSSCLPAFRRSGRWTFAAVTPTASALVAVMLTVAMLMVAMGPSVAVAQIDSSAEAAQAILDARERAGRAAAEFATAEAAEAELTDQLEVLEAQFAQTSAQLEQMSAGIVNLALDRFTSADSSNVSLLSGASAPTAQVEADVLARVATNASSASVDEYVSVKADLEAQRAVLNDRREQLRQTQDTLEAMRKAAEDEVQQLALLEQRLLRDEAVARALAAKKAEEKRQAEEAARAQADAMPPRRPQPPRCRPARPRTPRPTPRPDGPGARPAAARPTRPTPGPPVVKVVAVARSVDVPATATTSTPPSCARSRDPRRSPTPGARRVRVGGATRVWT
ncbi:MAG: hypothetical protein R2705_15935 [Ilumatobacteraceae bacterium]